MSKLLQLFVPMLKIGLIGFGGGNALIPVIERTVIQEEKLISRDDYDVDVMVASITPGALPVEIAGGVGRRVLGRCGLLIGAIGMALPGALCTVGFTSFMSQVNDVVLRQIKFVTVGIYAFICCLLLDYIKGTINKSHEDNSVESCLLVIMAVVILTCGKNLFRLLPGNLSPILSLNTIQVFCMAFFIIFYTRCIFTKKNVLIVLTCCSLFVLCNCKIAIIDNVNVAYFIYIVMAVLATYGIWCDIREGGEISKKYSLKYTGVELLLCMFFMFVCSIPAIIITQNAVSFIGHGFLSSIMSFGGGDAYLTVADGMFVQGGMITENEFYSILVPLVNVLPGSILCKTLSGVGYYVGIDSTGTILGGLLVALAGFATSVAASSGVFTLMVGIYEKFGTLNIFQLLKRWIRPIVSGLLINVMLSLLVQLQKLSAMFTSVWVPIGCMALIFFMDFEVYYRLKLKNSSIALLSVLVAIVICNLFKI